jgi:peroxiredoxin
MLLDIQNVFTNTHESLDNLTRDRPVLLVFLRHFGCIFCREALDDLSEKMEDISSRNIDLIFVHMSETGIAEKFFKEYNLSGVKHISDPSCELYAHFGLTKGNFGQLFGLSTWIRGFELRKKGIAYSMDQIGDSFQMPGIFLLHDGKVIDSYIHKTISDKPDYDKLIQTCVQAQQ